MRASTFQRIDIPLSRDLQTDYDKIVQLTEHLDAIEVVSDMLENGVDFNELLTLTSTVEDHTTALDGKVDKVAGSSLMTDAERAKLQFIAQQATKNQADAYLVDRANHTGTQSADTVVDGVVNVAMTAAERTRLAAMDDEANNYVHPASHPVSVLDGGTNYNKVVKTDALGNVGFGDTSWADVVGKPSTYTPNAHEHSMDEVTSGNISATRVVPTETRQFVNASQLANIADMELKTNKGIPNGYAPLDANGKISTSYINNLNLMEVFTPNDLNSMLNLTSAQPGDVAYRLDTGNSYMLIALPSSLEANWKQLNSGAGVVSVNGMDGIVTLGSANVPESGTNYYFTNERVDDRVVGLLQAGTNISLAYDNAANTLTVNANDVSVDWSEIQNKPDPVVTVTLQGDVTGTANATMTDMGNATVTVTTTVAANSVALGTDTTGNYVADVTAGTYVTKSGTAGEGWSPTINVDATSTNTASKVVARDASGNFAAGTITAALAGNAATATKLATARGITLSGDVTGTANFDGSAGVSITTTVADDSHLHAFTNLTSKPTTLSGYGITDAINASQKGVVNGVATLDASGLVPVGQLPSYVDDVLEYTNLGAFPAVGEPGKIYVALDTNKTYRWSGTVYIYITSGAVDSVAGKTGVVSLVKADVGLSNVDNTSDLLKPISTATAAELALKAPLASPALTGTPIAPTAAVGTSTTQLATTAFVRAEIANDTYSKADVDAMVVHKTGDETKAGVLTLTDGLKLQGQNVSPFSGFKNYIINGNFDVWQYGTSQTVNGYGSDDRWYNSNSGSTKTHSQVLCTNTERLLFNASKFSRTIVSSVEGASNYVTKRTNIEDVTKLAGKTITLSFWAKADSNKNIWLEFKQNFGTDGSPSALTIGIYGQAIPLTTTWQKKTITVTLPSIVGKTLGAAGVHTTSTEIQFWFDVGSASLARIPTGIQQSGTFDIAQVQLEEGSVATPFEQRPYGLELSLCQRYYETSYSNNVYPANTSTLGAKYSVTIGSSTAQGFTFIEPKRVPPTVAIYSPSGTAGCVWNIADIDNGSVTPNNIGTKGVRYLNNAIGNWTANSGVTYHYTASAEL